MGSSLMAVPRLGRHREEKRENGRNDRDRGSESAGAPRRYLPGD